MGALGATFALSLHWRPSILVFEGARFCEVRREVWIGRASRLVELSYLDSAEAGHRVL